MKILVLGAGMMGMAAGWDLARARGVKQVGIADMSREALLKAQQRIKRPNVYAHQIDVTNFPKVTELMRHYDATIGAVSYRYNFHLAKCAIAAGSHFCDLGGNDRIVEREFLLDSTARKNKVRIVPDCGLAPGMVSLVAAEGLKQFDRVDSVHIRVGGLPLHPKPPLNYQLVFSVGGLINEYIEPARVIEDGKIKTVESMTGVETLTFPPPFGKLEAFYTSGGASTLPLTLKGKVRELNYKTIRYPGHCEKLKTMIDLGLTSSEKVKLGNANVEPRALFEKLLVNKLPSREPDCVLIRVTLRGKQSSKTRRNTARKILATSRPPTNEVSYQLIDYYDPKTQLSAMMRTTAFPISIVAQMLCRGEVIDNRFGVLRQEISIPSDIFLNELKARKICFEQQGRGHKLQSE